MAATIFLILCVAASGFLLYCLFHFGKELRHESRSRADEDLWMASQKLKVVPVQFVGPASLAIWSEGTWHRVLSTMDDSKSRDLEDKGTLSERYDAAA